MEEIGATEILKKLVGSVSEEIASAWGFKDELKKLQSTLEMILAVIGDAEKRQEKEEVVRLWLRRLKDIAYDVEDVMDDLSYEDMRRRDRGKHKVINFPTSSDSPILFRLKMAKKIKEITKDMDRFQLRFTKDMDRFQLRFTTPIPDGERTEQFTSQVNDSDDGEGTEQLHRQFTSQANESEIVGREYDESQILKLLTTNTTSSSFANPNQHPENITAISIVGMAGLGKTTLAQLVFGDELVKKVFDLTIWVQVSEIFDIEIILVNIMESIIETKFHKPSNVHVLVDTVQKQLHGKKYLLVLDDLWNEDSEQWERLMSVLRVGAPGSKILITTRNDQVASIVRGSIPPYNLDRLEDDACWSIIKQKAFSPGGEFNAPKMSDIGKQIAKKCCGLPLAAKFLGSLMHLQNKESDWISIRDDDIWNTPQSERGVMPALKLSYYILPPPLKQCFSYCSIFPKNWEISKETLVHLWMAEGFLQQSDIRNKRSTEDLGRDYFERLAWSSFFQDFKRNDLGDIETCKMHDLVYDLAKDVLGENQWVHFKTSISEVRPLRLGSDEDISTSSAKKVRTLFIPEGSALNPSIFAEHKRLRILHVVSPKLAFPKLHSLSFKRIRHLRYLRLTSLDIREVENDQSIGELYNLETLILNNMYGVQNLLTNIQSLRKLRFLEVSCSDMVELPESITSLYNLETLDLSNCDLKVIPDSISGLKNLRFLNLSFNPIEEFPLSILTLSNLETIDVSSCKNLRALPEYVAGLTNLRIFDFKNCSLLKALPKDFGVLTQLRYLNLEGTEIKVLPESCANLNNLEYLSLFNCDLPKDFKYFTKLRNLIYNPLSNPVILGVGKLVCLHKLCYCVPEKLVSEPVCKVGIEELGNLKFLDALAILDLKNVKDPVDAESANLKGKQNLRQLVLQWGEELGMRWWEQQSSNDLHVLEALQPPSGLRELYIHGFMGWGLPIWMRASYGTLLNLDTLSLINCRGIRHLPVQLPRIKSLELEGMSLKSLDTDGFPSLTKLHLTDMFLLEELCHSYPSSLQDLWISGCKSLTQIPSFPFLTELVLIKVEHKLVCSVGRSQTSLTTLRLVNIEELVYFPVSILQNNCNLRILLIERCDQFQGFQVNEDGNENTVALLDPHGISLKKLQFIHCPVLKFLPDLRFWTSLQILIIFNCPEVKEYLSYDLKCLSFLEEMYVDFIQREDQLGDPSVVYDLINLMGDLSYSLYQQEDPSSSLVKGKLPELHDDVIQNDEQRGDRSSSSFEGKLPLPISYEKQRQFFPSALENIEVWACQYPRRNIHYLGESDPHIQSQQESLPTGSTSANLTQGDRSRPEARVNREILDPKKSKLYRLFPWFQRLSV